MKENKFGITDVHTRGDLTEEQKDQLLKDFAPVLEAVQPALDEDCATVTDLRPLKVAVIGSRTFEGFDNFIYAKRQFQNRFPNATEVVSGGARGADLIGKRIAEELKLKYTEFLPDWKTFGKRAGFLRNQDIINAADVVLAFWDGESRGTKHSIDLAKKANKEVTICIV